MSNFVSTNLKKLSLCDVKPKGWLKDQLMLCSVFQKKLCKKEYGFENSLHLPKFLKGLLYNSMLLSDESLKKEADKLMQVILNSADKSGNFGLNIKGDICYQIEVVKALNLYFSLYDDKNVLIFLENYFKYLYENLVVNPYWHNSRARLLELVPAIQTLMDIEEKEWLLSLIYMLKNQTNDWFKFSQKFPYKDSVYKSISKNSLTRVENLVESYNNKSDKKLSNELINFEWQKKSHQIAVETNGVNVAKAVKYGAVLGKAFNDELLKNNSLKLMASLEKYHGTPTGMFSSGPYLQGVSDFGVLDIEASVEYIESLVEVLLASGEFVCSDIIEKILFNLVPASFDEQITAVADYVYLNQTKASKNFKPYGLKSEIGTAFSSSFSKGGLAVLCVFPIFMQTLCMVRKNELNFFSYSPCAMNLNIEGKNLKISEETGYPFRNTIVFKVDFAEQETEVKMNFRVPKGAQMQLISGGKVVATGSKSISVKCRLKTDSTFMLKLNIPLLIRENKNGTISLMKGRILLSKRLNKSFEPNKADKNLINLNYDSKWNFAPIISKKQTNGVKILESNEQTIVNKLSNNPFCYEKPPFEVIIKSKKVENWCLNIEKIPELPKYIEFADEITEKMFMPFGCAMLHIANFPKCTLTKNLKIKKK